MNANNAGALELSAPVVITKNLQLFATAALGFIILFGVGFALRDVAHKAAHDTRHSVTFPCH
ncbi:MAG TPA: CbtB-domain containing protein [Methyloprofundus sp.]|uniref:CbtB domain-containing protein n=1 Tax=Methyloprofundus sp. TaxID=2020875 RepID=UPI0017923402|nr:CbtB domain-containing protein [Methyloprofundus sp.]HIG64045.1 CbtB-domain containing protein [Methyloprofundus sp.]HIL78144.1 CbtB-domain containing protein [Methylococcales bacterium]